LKNIDLNFTKHLPKITLDYLNNGASIKNFFNRSNSIENYFDQIDEKKNNYDNSYRKPLCDVLKSSYHNVKENSFQINAIKRIANENTFTITTGHQLNLFTGPLYFFYKIIDTINICKKLASKYPQYNFIPVYWMASEDHDYKEIKFFNSNNTLFDWNISTKGTVGNLETQSLAKVFDELVNCFGTENINSKNLIDLFNTSYIKNKKLSDATFNLVHNLFGKHGLLIINPDNSKLKKILSKEIIDEIINENCFKNVSITNKNLKKIGFNPQVNPRQINLFYLKKNKRSRIYKENSIYKVFETNISFTKSQIIDEVNNYPERFSPNVLFRPFFQEKILPNLGYVGGGSEIAYWLQLNSFFDEKNITFPILIVRNSVLLMSKKNIKKCEKLDLNVSDLFKKTDNLIKYHISKKTDYSKDFTKLKKVISSNFIKLYKVAHKTDKSFMGALKAQEAKQLKGLMHLEKRFIKAQKIKHKDEIERIKALKDVLFPNNSFQEREINFSEFYKDYGEDFINILKSNLKPFVNKFIIISL
jgi:bacillithiol biosynthesis cysteine-adding enzyme BshC